MEYRGNNKVSSITYGGQALTLVVARKHNRDIRVEIWGMLNPPSGSTNVTVTFDSATDGVIVGAASFFGVDQIAPLGTADSNSGTSATPTHTFASATNELAFAAVAFNGGAGLSVGANQTQLWSAVDPANTLRGSASIQAGTNTVTSSWSQPGGSAAEWALAAATMKEAAAADLKAAASGPATATPGANITYTLSVTNLGSYTSTNVVISNTLPAGVTFVSASNGATNNNGVVVWSAGNLTNNARTNFTVTVSAPTTAGTITNFASAGATTIDTNPSNNNGSSSGSRVITIINSLPVPSSPTISRWPATGAKIRVAQLLGIDPDGDSLSLVSAGPSSVNGGTVAVSGDWLFYVRAAGFTNSDSFQYSVADTRGGTSAGTVTVAISGDTNPSSNYIVEDLGNGAAQITFSGIPGRTYAIDFTDSLTPPNWQFFTTRVADSLGQFTCEDSLPTAPLTRSYRSKDMTP